MDVLQCLFLPVVPVLVIHPLPDQSVGLHSTIFVNLKYTKKEIQNFKISSGKYRIPNQLQICIERNKQYAYNIIYSYYELMFQFDLHLRHVQVVDEVYHSFRPLWSVISTSFLFQRFFQHFL